MGVSESGACAEASSVKLQSFLERDSNGNIRILHMFDVIQNTENGIEEAGLAWADPAFITYRKVLCISYTAKALRADISEAIPR